MNALRFASSEKGIAVTGKTFDVKEILKAKGAAWDPAAKAWVFRGQTDVEVVRGLIVEEIEVLFPTKKVVKRAARKVQPLDARARIVAARAGGARWICCDNCTVLDWVRQHVSCRACNPDGHIRVRGNCYTGD